MASASLLTPSVLIKCCRTISIKRINGASHGSNSAKGALGYSGTVSGGETSIIANYPASILQGTKGEENPTQLPLDVRKPWWVILLPAIPSVIFNSGDVVTCDLGRRYFISSAELTDMGWRMTASYERA